MPKVTDEHREQRREQILGAAWKCFAQNGFHGTSMSEVISEAGLSAGAVYLYFRSKEEIIVAVAEQVFGSIETRLHALADHEPAPSPAEVIGFLVGQPVRARQDAPGDLFPLLLSVWGEAALNPALNDLAEGILAGLRATLTEVLQRWADQGHRLPAPPQHLAPILMSLVQGLIVQQTLANNPAVEDYGSAVVALFEAAGLGGQAV